MRLGGLVPLDTAVRLGLSAAALPDLDHLSGEDIAKLRQRHDECDVLPVQLESYCNLISTDESLRAANIARVRARLQRADQAGALAVVVGGGHRNPVCPEAVFAVHPDNWRPEALTLLAQSCRLVLSGLELHTVKLVIETWVMTPVCSPQAARQLADLVDHPHFGLLFDPVNLMTPKRYVDNAAFMQSCLDTFGDSIVLVHAKDTLLNPAAFTYHMAEVPVGEGHLDYHALLTGLRRLPREVPIAIEHLADEIAYDRAAQHLRAVAADLQFEFH